MASLGSTLVSDPFKPLAVPAVVFFFLEVFAAVVLPQPDVALPLVAGSRRRIAVLVPAHNESQGLLETLDDIRAQLHAGDRILVVADNCTDDTASVARAAGAAGHLSATTPQRSARAMPWIGVLGSSAQIPLTS